ncbi:ribosome biogenesis GTPase Der [Marinilabiliaceae bacterium ANBcel2]|nr:ribosome biogenesis GTPase Der [Marinilabiliaceae bacterium ANBcel2]
MGNTIVGIVGRPNVGKSTLFNRLTGKRHAIVDEASGVTRDRIYGKTEWNGKQFSVIDTGGYAINSDDIFEKSIREQVLIAIEESDILLFIVDVTTGVTDYDQHVAEILRRANKPVIIVVNKVDTNDRIAEASYFYSLGFEKLFPISSINGAGTGELLDELTTSINLSNADRESEEEELPRFAIVGRPNAGKSSLINVFTGDERNIVTPVSGTTRDSLYTPYNKFGHNFLLVDTAGIRKKSKVHENLEFYSVMRAVRAIENCDVSILVIDATRGFEGQDQKIFSLIERNRKGVVVVVNKWDLIEKDKTTVKDFETEIRNATAPYTNYPIIFSSALTKQRVYKILEETIRVDKNRKRKISTSKLNDFMLPIIKATPPPATKGKYIKIKYITQLPSMAPSFAFYCNLPQYVKEPYKRFLENHIRKQWDFSGVPINIFMRKK